ncbi:MAG: glycosyl hydrolase family 28-related protein [Candidatus Sumerlaeota bacterium]|nr:glycosyl hydrolase family 28-related protein [Candidatus Sumerlaeota bacterium]
MFALMGGVLISAAIAPIQSSTAEDFVPPDSGVIDVTKPPYGVDKTGVADATKILQQAIYDNIEAGEGAMWKRDHILYFPKGTYLISDRLEWRDKSGAPGHWHAYLSFLGESRDQTIIKLKDGAFTDAQAPKGMIMTASEQTPADWADWQNVGGGISAFRNNISNLTFDVGSGNPGGIGMDYLGSNQTCIENVLIRSSDPAHKGSVGLSMTRPKPGPLLVKDVTIDGFDTGVSVAYEVCSCTFVNLTLRNQNVTGFHNNENVVSIENLKCTETNPGVVPVKQTHPNALLTLVNAKFEGRGDTAVLLNDDSKCYGRDISAPGYAKAVSGVNHAKDPREFVSHEIKRAWDDSAQSSLCLPIQNTPDCSDPNPTDWMKVEGLVSGTPAKEDSAPAFQAAIEAANAKGKTVLYVPFGAYFLGGPIRVHGGVKKIKGFGVSLYPLNEFDGPAFLFETKAPATTVCLEGLYFGRNPWSHAGKLTMFPMPTIEHKGPNPLVLRHIQCSNRSGSFRSDPGAGPVFLEDVFFNEMEFNGGKVWARALDDENPNTTRHFPEGEPHEKHITNNGAALWILGLKTEGLDWIIHTTKGGSTEVLGAFNSLWQSKLDNSYCGYVTHADPGYPNSRQSLVFATGYGGHWAQPIQESREGKETRTLSKDDFYPRQRRPGGAGYMAPLYVGYASESGR